MSRFRSHKINNPNKQKGAALLLFVLLLVTGASALLVSKMNKAATQSFRDHITMRALNEAKEALIGWSLNHPVHPGVMPFSDRIASSETTNPYDGFSDCRNFDPADTGTNRNNFLLGKVPWRGQNTPCTGTTIYGGLKTNYQDPNGEVLWYAVSKNMLNNGVDYRQIGPDLLSRTTDWITVLDQNGNEISNRVAFVLIAPGEALSNQNRNGNAPVASEFLDSVTVGGATYSNADTASNFDFIIYPNSKTTLIETDEFNDTLVFVTIDELISSAAKRAIGEVSTILSTYQRINTMLPWLSPYSDPINPTDPNSTFNGVPNTRQGHLPIHLPNETYEISSSNSFSATWNIPDGTISPTVPACSTLPPIALCEDVFQDPTYSDPIFVNPLLQGVSCIWTNKDQIDCTATKSGTGGETRTYHFIYTTTSNSVLPLPASPDWTRFRTFNLTSTPPTTSTIEIIDTDSLGTETGRAVMDFSSVSSATNTFDLSVIYDLDPNLGEIPQWFLDGNWHHYFYIAYASGDDPPGGQVQTCNTTPPCLTLNTYAATSAGSGAPENSGDFRALILYSGSELTGQDRTTGGAPITDYFEGHDTTPLPTAKENVDGNDIFDALIQADDNFNDQVRAAFTCTTNPNELCWIP